MNNENKGQSPNPTDGDRSYLPDWVIERMKLGEQRKLWSIEIIYIMDNDPHTHRERNLTRGELYQWRESAFRYGITHKVEGYNDTWRVIPPVDIVQFTCVRQEKYLPQQF